MLNYFLLLGLFKLLPIFLAHSCSNVLYNYPFLSFLPLICRFILQKLIFFLKAEKNVSVQLGAEVGKKTVLKFYRGMQLLKHTERHVCINNLVQIRAIINCILNLLGVGSLSGAFSKHKN